MLPSVFSRQCWLGHPWSRLLSPLVVALQSLGLTRYEIPIDSRLTDWLNEFGFPVRLTATALGDENYYRFISDGIQVLCERSGVLPCIFDAAVFTAGDSVAWTDDNVIF